MNDFLDYEGLEYYDSKLRNDLKSSESAGVTSFHGRTGAVSPKDGDYNALMVGAVPTSRTVNGKSLETDITLTPEDIGIDLSDDYVPTSRTVNGKALSSNITLTPEDIGAQPSGSYVPTSRTVNGKALSSNITLTASDVSALPLTGGTLSGNLTLKGSGNFGTQINLGDGDYVHISEPTDDCLEVKANKVNFVLSDTTDTKFTINSENPFGGGSDVESGSYVGTGSTTSKTISFQSSKTHRLVLVYGSDGSSSTSISYQAIFPLGSIPWSVAYSRDGAEHAVYSSGKVTQFDSSKITWTAFDNRGNYVVMDYPNTIYTWIAV